MPARIAALFLLSATAVLTSLFVGYRFGTLDVAARERLAVTERELAIQRARNETLNRLSRTPQWGYSVNQNNQETKNGVWNFMDEDENERSRHAIMGSVYIRKHAPPNGIVLDLGCATGTLSDFIIPSQTYEGYDVGCEAINRGKLKRPMVNLTCADAATLIPRRAYYDVIVMSEMLYYMDVRSIIEKYMAHLRPKTGFIIISLFKFLHLNNGKNDALKKDVARENITAIVHTLLTPLNKVG